MWQGNEPIPRMPDQGEAVDFLVESLRQKKGADPRFKTDVWLPDVITEYLYQHSDIPRTRPMALHWIDELSSVFSNAVWDLCRFGVLRPGGRTFESHAGTVLQSFSLTSAGRVWLAERSEHFVPTSLERLSSLLAAFDPQFGMTYRERAQDAARCYSVQAFFACCAMVGAASEAILLKIGEIKFGNERALSTYRGSHGRSRLELQILANANAYLKNGLQAHTDLINFWRDTGSHASPTKLSEDEAYTALRGLLRFAHFAVDNWSELTSPKM